MDGVFPNTLEKCISCGGWLTENRFMLHCEVKDRFINGMELHVSLRNDLATVRVVGSLRELISGWNGLAWGRIRK